MLRKDFNHEWTCRPLSREGEKVPVTLPYDAMRTEKRTPESMGEGNIGWYEGGDYEYERILTLSSEDLKSRMVLEFETVYRNSEVWINDRLAAARPYGYTNFYVDLKGLVKEGDNTIRVIARNADQPNSRWYSGTGMLRPVWLWQGPEEAVLINGVKIRTLKAKPARIEVKVLTTVPGRARIEIFCQGDKAAEAEVSSEMTASGPAACTELEIPDARLWSVDHPNLYTCRVSFGEDVCEETFGIRILAWDAKKGMTINGKRVILRGACIHHDNGILGGLHLSRSRREKGQDPEGERLQRHKVLPLSRFQRSAGGLRQAGHADDGRIRGPLVHAQDQVRLCRDPDEVVEAGSEGPGGQGLQPPLRHHVFHRQRGGGDGPEEGHRSAAAVHPLSPRPGSHKARYLRHQHLLQLPFLRGPWRLFGRESGGSGQGGFRKAASGDGKDAKKKKSVGSEFYNMLAVKMGTGFMKFGASLPPSDWMTRDAFSAMDIAGYNYGIDRYKKDLKKYPGRLILGSETFCTDAYAFWEIARDNPRILGDFVWSGWDYIGETGLGGAEYSDYLDERPETQMTGGNGRIDLSGKPRCEAYYTRVALERETGPYIGVYPVYEKKPQFNGWTMSKALRSWSWPGFEGREAEVEVYARADSVELFVNGKSVGKNFLKKDCRTTFRTPYASGSIEAVSYDPYGIEIGRDRLETAGEKTLLQVKPESASVRKEGLVFVPLQYTDEKGIWKPMEKHTLKVEIQGGQLMGLGNAGAYFEGNYAGESVPTYFGEALAAVRADGTGPVKVTVSDEKAASAVIPLAGNDIASGRTGGQISLVSSRSPPGGKAAFWIFAEKALPESGQTH